MHTARPALLVLTIALSQLGCGDDDPKTIPGPDHGLDPTAVIAELSAEERTRLCEDSMKRMQAATDLRARCSKRAKLEARFSGMDCEEWTDDCVKNQGSMLSSPPTPSARCANTSADAPGEGCALTVDEYASCVGELARNQRIISKCNVTLEDSQETTFSCTRNATGCTFFTD